MSKKQQGWSFKALEQKEGTKRREHRILAGRRREGGCRKTENRTDWRSM
jgi:hypothetical protein